MVIAQCPTSSTDDSGGFGGVFNFNLTSGTPTCIELDNSITIGTATYGKNACMDGSLANYIMTAGTPTPLPNTVDFGGTIGYCAYDASGTIRTVGCPVSTDDSGSGGGFYDFDLSGADAPLCSDLPTDVTINGQPYTRNSCSDGVVAQFVLTGGTPATLPAVIDFGGVVGACSYDGGGALPVELIKFSAVEKNENVLLEWQTASEENNAGFHVEHSNNAQDWLVLDFVEGRGTTDLTQNYTYTDRRPVPGDNYYRLKQVDFDGKYEYSDTRIVKIGGSENKLLEVFPNPNRGQFTLSLHNPSLQKARIKLFDSTGNMIWQQDFRGSEAVSYWEKKFDLPQREVYFVMTQVGDQVETKKVSVISEK